LLLSDAALALRAPRLRVLANGQLITGAMDADVISNNYYAADRFHVVVALGPDAGADASFWASESNITLDVQFSLDGGTSFSSLVQGAVDGVSIEPVLRLVRLDGRDLTAGLIEACTQETFANRTSSEIACILASRHDLAAHVSSTTTPAGRYYHNEHDSVTLDQFSRATTEWDLLVYLARQEGFDVYVQGQALYFQPTAQETDLTVSLRPEDVIDIRLDRSLILAGDIEVLVKSWNSRRGNAFLQKVRGARVGCGDRSSTVQRYVIVQPNLAPDDALKLGQRKLAELTRHERVIRITMPGEIALTPRNMIALEGTGTEFDQVYYIDEIERNLRHGAGLTQRIIARNTSPRTEISGVATNGTSA
jgi:hypothetical protein